MSENVDKVTLADLVKKYEKSMDIQLIKKEPVVMRLDGKSFSKLTRVVKFERPYCNDFNSIMDKVCLYLFKNIQGCICASRHSDEMSFLLIDYLNSNSCGFFDYRLQKMVSVSAGWASNKFTTELLKTYGEEWLNKISAFDISFDSRVFNVKREDVRRYFLSRYLSGIKNSVSMHSDCYYSHKELMGKKTEEKKEMLLTKGIEWDKLPESHKYGTMLIKDIEREGKDIEMTPMDFGIFGDFVERYTINYKG
jgi:tRNA(His) 5'-end guanylyltransferase